MQGLWERCWQAGNKCKGWEWMGGWEWMRGVGSDDKLIGQQLGCCFLANFSFFFSLSAVFQLFLSFSLFSGVCVCILGVQVDQGEAL
jgi:hypothetical protein